MVVVEFAQIVLVLNHLLQVNYVAPQNEPDIDAISAQTGIEMLCGLGWFVTRWSVSYLWRYLALARRPAHRPGHARRDSDPGLGPDRF